MPAKIGCQERDRYWILMVMMEPAPIVLSHIKWNQLRVNLLWAYEQVQACEAQGWYLHAWCLLGNHYHLLLETPEPNLVAGMKWLQGTFAIRFNRFRKENDHVPMFAFSLALRPAAAADHRHCGWQVRRHRGTP
jgi:REP element-mobilizing transposase RayT